MIRYALLSLLREKSDYGYNLKRRFDEKVGLTWRLNIGQVYQTLHALERAGCIRAVREPEPAGEHPWETPKKRPVLVERRTFELTDKGQRVLNRWLRKPGMPPRPVRDELLIRMLALDGEQRSKLHEDIGAVFEEQARLVAKLVAREKGLEASGKPADVVKRLNLSMTRRHAQAHLAWLADCATCIQPCDQPEDESELPEAAEHA